MPLSGYNSFNKILFVCLCIFVLRLSSSAVEKCNNGNKQPNYCWDFNDKDDETFISSFLSEIFTPKIIIDIKCVRKYIMDERFQDLRNNYGDMRSIDAIYLKSLKVSEYNITRALFISFMAVIEHRRIGIKVPIIKSIYLPLTLERDSTFTIRVKHLPSHIYDDTLAAPNGDIDKLQHFFGSAYLAYSTEAPGLAQNIGNFIEWGEAMFIVDGTDDPRDKRANKQGESFGRDLMDVKTLLPSDYLTFSNEESK